MKLYLFSAIIVSFLLTANQAANMREEQTCQKMYDARLARLHGNGDAVGDCAVCANFLKSAKKEARPIWAARR